MATTKKPFGPGIKRKGNKFILSWKHGEKYEQGQRLEWWYSWQDGATGGVVEHPTVKLSSAKKDYTVTVSRQGVTGVGFSIRGKAKKKSWSAWTTHNYDIRPPQAPKVTASWDSATPNKTTFHYEAKDSDHAPYDHCIYQTILVQDCPEDYKAESLWKNATAQTLSGTAGNFQTSPEAGLTGSNARVVRVKAVGMGGESAWRYAHHVYAQPNAPYNVDARAVYNPGTGYFDTTVTWSIDAPKMQRPVDETGMQVQYQIGVPASGMVPPTNSWNPAGSRVNAEPNIWQGGIGEALQNDECLFLRVQANHDNDHNESDFLIAAYGRLAKPTNISTLPDQGTHKIQVTATNNSTQPDAQLAVIYQDPETHEEGILGVGSSPLNVTVPEWDGTVGNVGVFAFTGVATAQPARTNGVKTYAIDAVMTSETVWSGTVQAPVLTAKNAGDETALLEWTWPWDDATSCELSWSDHADAWESTDQPQTYDVNNLHASKWYIKDLEAGKVWYFRARLYYGEDSEAVFGSYSNMAVLDLTAAPDAPVLELSDEIITADGETTASWQFITSDNTKQGSAVIAEVINTGSADAYTIIGTAETAQNITLNAADINERFPQLNWTTGTQHKLAVKVFSTNNRESAWSGDSTSAVALTIADALTCTIVQNSLVATSETIDGTTITYDALTALPLTVTATGAGTQGKTAVQIVRAEDYFMDRPDGRDYTGYNGQIIASKQQAGEGQLTFDRGDITGGHLDDGAQYIIFASVQDNLGQMAIAEKPFTVRWSHQAVKAEGTVALADDVAYITPTTPTDTPVGWTIDPDDTVDIYRLSSGRPELLVQGATIGQTYVDPHPTIGKLGGYRLAFVTADGDYITEDTEPSWIDIPAGLETLFQYIDFDGQRIELKFNVTLDMTLTKTQTITHYLGGSIQGDTLEGVEGAGNIQGVIPYDIDEETYKQLLELGEYTGPARIRSNQGANYEGLVNVQDGSTYDTPGHPHNATLQIQRVDPQNPEGVLLTDWLASA